jgi:uncharacterized protein YjiS (DUF1127 family)
MRTLPTILLRVSWPDRLSQALPVLTDWLWASAERSAQRRALAELDDARLRDIGLTRAEAQVEAARPFWWR